MMNCENKLKLQDCRIIYDNLFLYALIISTNISLKFITLIFSPYEKISAESEALKFRLAVLT